MTYMDTKYGVINDVTAFDYYDNGDIRRCIVCGKNLIKLTCGTVVPQYIDDGKRKKLIKSMTFYKAGNLDTVILQNITSVETSLGVIPAEMVTFYESGSVKRIFPSFGTITAFWTEEDEYEFAPEISVRLPFGKYQGKAINIMFTETGELKSMTLWPKDSLPIETAQGKIITRIGFSQYADGKIRSVEPRKPVLLNTPIGALRAFDPDALGIDGDNNSVVFARDGGIKSLLTSEISVTVMRDGEAISSFAPIIKSSNYFDDELALDPLKISFANGFVRFGRRNNAGPEGEYHISEHEFLIEAFNSEGYRNLCEECCG